jgi:IS5 family transposase
MSGYTWEYIRAHQKETKRLLGISFEQLEQLIEQVKILHNLEQEEKFKKNPRLIAAGGGRLPKLALEEQLILTLMYLRHHLTFQVLGLLFQVSESAAHNIFNYWQNILREALPASLLEQVKKSNENIEDFLEELSEQKLVIDSVEQAIERPLDYQTQKKYYSGKKHYHTFKTQLIVLPSGKDIVDVIAGKPGPVSDIKLAREQLSKLHPNQILIGDKAYVGSEQIKTPTKKPPKRELTKEQKEANKKLSQERIFVEHVIRTLKIFRVAQERFRLRKNRYESIIFNCCGLVRLRIGSLILKLLKNKDCDNLFTIIQIHNFVPQEPLEACNP